MSRFGSEVAKQGAADAERAGGTLGGRLSKGMKFAAIGGAAAIGAVIGKGIADNISIAKANDKLAAQMGSTVKESARIGKLAGSLYRDAYGESLGEVQSALRGLQSNIGDLSKFSNREIESMGAKALDLAAIMGEDVAGVTRGVGQLIRNGLAKDATEGFDIITRVAQSVPETMQGELLETIEEYGADFEQLGLTGEQAMGAISAAVKAGARNTDLAADAFREFSIRAIDGSKATASGYRALGLDADDMAQKIAAGGPAATEATSTIIRRLKGMKDPVKQEAAGVALFGTRYEELGIKAIGAMDPMKSELKNVKGAAKDAGDTLNDNFATRVDGWKRKAQGFVQDGLMSIVRGFEDGEASGSGFDRTASSLGETLRRLADFGKRGFAWAKDNQTTVKVLTGLVGFLTIGIVTYNLTVRVTTGVTKAWTAAQLLLNGALRANPIGLVVTALTLLGAALVLAYKKSDTFRRIVDKAWAVISGSVKFAWERVIKPALSAFRDFVTKTLPDGFSRAVSAIGRIWDRLKSAAMAPVKFVVETVYNKGIVPMLSKIPGVSAPGKVYIGGISSYGNRGGTYQDPGQRFAHGGAVHGGIPGKDSVRAWLMPEEHVWTRDEVKGAGGHMAMRRMRELAKKKRLGRLGDPGWDLAPGFAEGGGFTDGQIKRAQSFARSQAGKPYIWGGVGPGGYDCSGFMSAIVNVLRGGSPYSRVGTSSTFPWPGFRPGLGQFSVGAFTGSPGHVAGTLGGMNVESTNGSVRVGPAARGATNSMFTRVGHLGAGGNFGGGPGGFGMSPKESALAEFGGALKAIKSFVAQVPGWFSGLTKLGGWGGLMKQMSKAVVNGVGQFINDKIPDRFLPDNPIPTFDRGGYMRPGLAFNGSKSPEAVFTEAQWATLRSVASSTISGRPGVNGNGPMEIRGTLDTAWGPAQVRGTIREEIGRAFAGQEKLGHVLSGR